MSSTAPSPSLRPVSHQGCCFDSLPSLSNYNSSPETSCIAHASETVYPFRTPVIHLKGERSEDRSPCEATAPVVEGLVEKRNMEEVGMTQPAGEQHWMDSCMGHDKSRRMQDSQRQDAMDLAEERSSDKGCTQRADRSSVPQEEVAPQTGASSERAPCQQDDGEKGVSGEKQGKDLNRTPRKMNKRKKHRPKIMEQGKPTRTPKPVTPSRAEEKKDRTAKRHYVRNKGLNSSQTPSGAVLESMDSETATTSGRTIDQQSKGPKSVRRSLNFDSEAQAMDVCQVPITISAQNQARETSTNTCTTGSSKSTVKVADGLEVVVEHSEAGIAFDLTRSLNQVLEEYIRSPGGGTAPDLPSRRELIRENLKQQAQMGDRKSINDPDCFQPSPENSNPPTRPSIREMIRENSKRNNRKQSNSNSQRDEILIQDDIEKNGTKRDRSHVDDIQTCYDAASRDVHLLQDSEDLRHLMRAIIPKPCKKRRTEKRKTWKYAQGMQRNSSSFTSANLQGQIILDKVQVSEKMIELGRAERTMKKRPELPIRVRTLAYIASIMKCSQILSAPEKPRPQICMEALLIDGGLKTETKKHTKRGRVSINPMSSTTNQEAGDMSCNCSSDEQRYDALTTPSIINFEIRNSNEMQISSIQECQSSSIVQDWHRASLQSRAIVPYVHPMDKIVQELKCLDINGHQTDTTAQAQHALIPYGGDGMMVTYKGPFDPTKKPRPRAKVDLDPESNRVWKLLMGKESHDEADGSDMSKEKWLEEDRKIYRGRAESFILRMRLLQGNRRFSQWKGSVVDSVVGVFLTQNVSDHLSSSAFMHLAARFPAQPKGNRTESDTKMTNTPEEQGHESILNMDDATKRQEDTLCPEFGDQGYTISHEVEQKEENEIGNSGISLERYHGSITTEYIKSKGWDDHGRELQMGDQTPQNRIDNPVTGRTSSPEPEYKRPLEDVVVLSSQSSVSSAKSEAYLINGTKCSNSDCSNSSVEPVQIAQTTRTQEPYNCGTEWKCSIECCSAIAQRESINTASTNEYSLEHDKHRSEPQQEGRKADSNVENTQHTVGVLAPMQYHETQSACSNSCKTSEAVVADEPDLKDEVYSSQLPDIAKSTSKNKAEEADTEKETFDWDNLRKEACCNGADRERSNERLDSLDWEAVRSADVNEIAQTIKDRGMHNVLAQKIKDFLDRVVRDHGSTNLEWLRNVPPDKAKEYLLSIRGLGLKSVECIRLLTLNHQAFPVDTNVGRICVRLGWVPLKPLPGDVQFHLLEQYPMMDHIQRYIWPRLSTLAPETLYELHYHMITFGKVFCTKRRPNCDACPMRGDCRHYASECASARLKLQWPEGKNPASSMIPITSDDCGPVFKPMHVPQLDGIQIQLSQEGRASPNCGPIIEEPASPEPESIEALEPDFEDLFSEDPDEIPHIKLNLEGTQYLHNLLQADNVELEDSALLKAIVALTTEAVSIPMPKLKNAMRLRTEHQVYELPDSHPLLERVDQREPDDPCPYLLAIWTPGETAQSTQQPETCCDSQELGIIDNNKTCSSGSNMQEVHAQTVRGTILIPCRTAMRGSFPLNGTYFQVNEVFADQDTSCKPMDIPREWIWNLPRRTVYVGTSVPAIFRGLTAESIQHCFYRGYVCVRGFDRKTRRPMPLTQRLHFSAYKASRDKKAQAKEE